MESTFVVVASVMGFLGVAIGAFGAHSLAAHFKAHPESEPSFKTGVQYHFYHALALLAVAWATGRWPLSGLIVVGGWLFVLGIMLFSGSLYTLTLTGNRKLGMITPLGGLAFLAGWVCLLLGVLQG
jgi:uncharacterized membrane protein YgdD (TMEM256/DUF423 family)